MKKYILFLIFLLLLTSNCFGQQLPKFSYNVKIETFYPEMRNFSGTVIRCDDDEIHVLTCWHGFMGFTNPKSAFVTFVSEECAYVTELRIEKSDIARDIVLLRGLNIYDIKSDVAKISDKNPEIGSACNAYGFGLSRTIITRPVNVKHYDKMVFGTNYRILSTDRPMPQGMSGGGLIQNGKLCGVLSSAGNTESSYCPADQLLDFVKK